MNATVLENAHTVYSANTSMYRSELLRLWSIRPQRVEWTPIYSLVLIARIKLRFAPTDTSFQILQGLDRPCEAPLAKRS